MIYGQSGSGSKATTLMGMPSAAGLIHRASAQSGGGDAPDAEQSREYARQVCAELGVKDMAALQKMGWSRLNSIGNAIRMATMKYEQKSASVFLWYFSWQSPMLEDSGAWHTAELAFCFDNTKRCEQGTGNGPEGEVRRILLA